MDDLEAKVQHLLEQQQHLQQQLDHHIMTRTETAAKLYLFVIPFVNVICKTVTSVSVAAQASAWKLHGGS